MTSLSLVLLAATIVVSSFVSGVFGMAGRARARASGTVLG